jgi:hypothetical protein
MQPPVFRDLARAIGGYDLGWYPVHIDEDAQEIHLPLGRIHNSSLVDASPRSLLLPLLRRPKNRKYLFL